MSLFDLAAHFELRPYPTLDQFCKLAEKRYGIRDLHRYYVLHRQHLLQKNLPDPWSITRQPTLAAWWHAKRQLIEPIMRNAP